MMTKQQMNDTITLHQDFNEKLRKYADDLKDVKAEDLVIAAEKLKDRFWIFRDELIYLLTKEMKDNNND